ncbi:MAG: primosomal protein N' [Oscillospiraceae bacterium]|nr:primosomal protein N' [Oscillospiraceae bacterium]
MNDKILVAVVAVDKCLYPFDNLYDYRIPDSLADKVQAGQLVMVPFGKGNRKRIAMIYSVEQKDCDPAKLKPVYGTAGNGVTMSAELLDLSVWLKENTFCTYFDAIRTILPHGLNFSVRAEYSLAEGTADLTDSEKALLETLKAAKTEKELSLLLDSAAEKKKTVESLTAKGFVVRGDIMKRHIGDETERMVRLSPDFELNDRFARLTAKQKSVIETLIDNDSASVKELCYICSVTPVVIKNLVKYQLLEEYTYTLTRAESAFAQTESSPQDITLSPDQDKVFGGIAALMTEDKPNCALLHGVTGSGKTSIFIRLIDLVLQQGRTALMLVPEISLTPQMVSNFQRIFGSDVAIIHSNLSMGRRADEYRRISSGEARIVIGTRSAVFAPLDNIGIIVIDEEGEHTYKSDRSPRYHARSVAKQRAFRHNSLLLLASATPSLESFYNAQKGRYALFTLSERFNKTDLPEVYLIDMKAEQENGNRGNFSEALLHEIGKNLENGEQTLLLLNRRGYHTYISCINCGAVMECPNCGVPLTYHKANETVLCHYCGHAERMPDACPKCKSTYISQSGTGTQRIEDEISGYFPKARILRMDADTTMSKNAFSDRFAEFGRGEYDIMVGTQMIAKGLDFENVTLVGVLMIDKSLYSGDYLGYERTFSLITQVVGRSGRGAKIGRAYLQTFSPDHYVLQLAARQDYAEFYSQEIDVRQALLFPPFCDICLVGFSSLSEQHCETAANRFLQLLKDRIKREQNLPIRVLGPTKMGTGRLGGRFRRKLVIKCRFNKQFRAIMTDLLLQAYKDQAFTNVSFYVDINGEII